MEIDEIYGVDEPVTPRPSTTGPTDDATEPQSDPPESDEAESQEESAAERTAGQTPAPRAATPPTRDAVAEIERMLSTGGHRVGAAVPFLDSAAHNVDADDKPNRSTKKRGKLAALIDLVLGPHEPDSDDADDTDRDDSETSDNPADKAAIDPAPKKFGPLRSRHLLVGAAFAAVALLGATLVGHSQTHEDTSSVSAAAGAPPAAPTGARDTPIAPTDVTDPDCGVGSSDPHAAFGNDKHAAWVCLSPYNGVGQILTITLPGPFVITSIRVMPGFNAAAPDNSDMWVKYRTLAQVKWRFDGNNAKIQTFDGSRKEQAIATPANTIATVITMTIRKTDAPKAAQTTQTAAIGPPSQNGGNSGWLDNILQGKTTPGQTPQQNANTPEPDAFAVSSIQIIGHRAQ
ncbi:hypothetical protein JF729_18285 [Mycobacterium intracellulare]|uniref:hypothetical protein n=1 Tax=Mycobacterium intracellulare TaxID=1767 RepID=UPI001CD9F1B6|nr:hypothetical protein [Mycobacterium intracellulare]MCA2249728.1 hypothetical protein [Mycobacterium intracellulare]